MSRSTTSVLARAVGATAIAGLAVPALAYDLSSDVNANAIPWQKILVTDPGQDQQTGQGETDFLGTADAPMLLMYFDGTTLFIRTRLNGKVQTPPPKWTPSANLTIGFDYKVTDLNWGDMDLLVTDNPASGSGGLAMNATRVVGDNLNQTPNTTSWSFTTGGPYQVAHSTTNYNFQYVTDGIDANDPDEGSVDGWHSFSYSMANLTAASGNEFTASTQFKIGMWTSTQANVINQDVLGLNKDTPWIDNYPPNDPPFTLDDLNDSATASNITLDPIHMTAGGTTSAFGWKSTTVTSTTYGTGNLTAAAGTGSNAEGRIGDGTFNPLTAAGQTSPEIEARVTGTSTAGTASGTLPINYFYGGVAGGSDSINVTGDIYSGISEWKATAGGTWTPIVLNPNTTQLTGFTQWESDLTSPGTDKGGAPGSWVSFDGVDSAFFGNQITGSQTITMADAFGRSVSVKSVEFNNTEGEVYTIGGTGTLALKSGNAGAASMTDFTNPATLKNTAGNHVITAPLALNSATEIKVADGTKLTVNQLMGAGYLHVGNTSSTGTLILTGNSDNTGNTTVQAGTLQLDGTVQSGANTNGIYAETLTVDYGARLTSSELLSAGGTVDANAVINGTISPGGPTAISTLTANGAETWGSTGAYEVTLGTAVARSTETGDALSGSYGTSDLLVINGNLTVQNGFDFNLFTTGGTSPTGWAPQPNVIYEWIVAQYSGGLTASLVNLILPNVSINNTFGEPSYKFSVFTTDLGGNQSGTDYIGIRYTYNAVPEATTLLLGSIGLTPLILQRRRARRKTA